MLILLEGLSVPILLEHVSPLPYSSLRYELLSRHQVDINAFSVYLSGRLLSEDSTLVPCSGPLVLRLQSRVLGGKGGFGSQLKAIGAQIQKTTSREACRDLSGRRVRDVNAEKQFQQLAREEKRRSEERKQQQVRRREKRWAQRTNRPRLQDPQYYQSLEDNEQRVSDALRHALKRKQGTVQAVCGAERPVFRGMGDLSDSESETGTLSFYRATESVGPTDPDTKMAGMDTVSSVSEETHAPPHTTSPPHSGTTSLTTPLDTFPDDNPEINIDTNPDNTTTDEAVPLLPDPVPIPEVSTPDPIAATPDPIAATPDLIVSTPDPIAATPDPIAATPDPIAATPEPIAATPDPIAATPEPIAATPDPIELDSISSRDDLEKFSLKVLKITLMSFGLKCGGTLQERVERLYTFKVTPKEQLLPSIFAAKGKSAGKKSEKR